MIFGALILQSGTISGKYVALHIIVSKYLFPAVVFGGRGSTQSIISLLNSFPQAGIGLSEGTGMGLFGLPPFGKHDMFYKILPHLETHNFFLATFR